MNASVLEVGTPPLQFPALNQLSSELPFQLACPKAGAEEKHASARRARASGIQAERPGSPFITEKTAFIAESPFLYPSLLNTSHVRAVTNGLLQ
jgi:hypothetical protein